MTDILVLRFYGYIEDISMDILTQNISRPKNDQKSWKCKKKKKKKTLRYILRSIIIILKLFC